MYIYIYKSYICTHTHTHTHTHIYIYIYRRYRVTLEISLIINNYSFYSLRLNLCLLKEERTGLLFLCGLEVLLYQKRTDILNAHLPKRAPIGVLTGSGYVVKKFNPELLHWVSVNLAKRIERCSSNSGNHIKDVID